MTVRSHGIWCHLHVSGRVSSLIPMVISDLKAGLVGMSRYECCIYPYVLEVVLHVVRPARSDLIATSGAEQMKV